METLKTSETLIEGLVASKQDGTGNLVKEFKSFDLGEKKSTPVAENGNVSIKGISLFVELTGGVTNDVSHHKLNGSLLNRTQSEIIVGQQENRVNVGDFVWANVKKQSWWPGVICDTSSAPKEATNIPTTEDCFLVKCFGNENYVWCLPYQLKPFAAHYEQLSNQRKSKSFNCALEMAVIEYGNSVKSDFTCLCSSNRMVERKGYNGNLLVTRFVPTAFLDYIKDLARDIIMPSKMDYAVNKNCLSAFYRSLGHCEIPMHQLKPAISPTKIKIEEESGCFDETYMGDYMKSSNGKSENGCKTRESRRNRFFSHPYSEESKAGVDLNETIEQPVKKPRKKWTRKSVVKPNVCSSEVLSELQCAALDCLFPYESKKFDSVQRYITGFRKLAFSDSASNVTIQMQTQQMFPEIGVQSEKGTPKKARKKKNDSNNGSMILDFQNVNSHVIEAQSMANSHVVEAQSMANKRTEVGPDQGFRNIEVTQATTDLNGNYTFFNFGDHQQPAPCKLIPKKRKMNEANDTCIPAWRNEANDASIPAWNSNITVLPNVNGHMHFQGLLNQAPAFHFMNEVGSAPPANIEKKKRGRKRKNFDLQTNSVPAVTNSGPTVTSSGPTVMLDLNENGVENKKAKRVKKRDEIGVACIDLVYNKAQQDDKNGEITGTAFLLKFSSDHPLPSIHDLNSVFSKYGGLYESETQVSNEKLSGQVVFINSSSAGDAFWGLQNHQPFGEALVNYRIQHLAGADSTIGFRTPIKNPTVLKPNQLLQGEITDAQAIIVPTVIPDLNGISTAENNVKRSIGVEEIRLPVQPHMDLCHSKVPINNPPLAVKSPLQREPRDLVAIKKNLEMMKKMLEKAGGSLSLEMRVKLESEIQGLMNKVTAMDDGSSSSCL